MKKVLSILLCIVTLLSLLPVSALAGDSALTVTFSNTLAGSAAGTYTFTAESKGTYGFYWTDAAGNKLKSTRGEKTIAYTAINSFTASAGQKYVFSPNKFLAIPEGAKNLAVIDSTGKTAASYALPTEKLQTSSSTYSYGLLSDLHYDGTYSNIANKTVPAALAFFKSAGVTYAFGAGDIVTNAEEEFYVQFASDVKNSGVIFLTCGGNHEVVGGYAKMFGTEEETGFFQKHVNAGVYDGTLEGVKEFAPNGYDFVFQIPGYENDVFIFVSQYRWDDRSTTMKPLIEPETLTWLGEMFEKYKDKTVHYFQHTLLADDDGTHSDGEGDIANKVGKGYDYHFNVNTAEEKVLRSLMENYKNVIWYNGHSHWTFDMDKYNPNLNIFDYEGTTATMVHIPSVTAPRTIGDTETDYHSNAGTLSMGLLTDVHNGYEIVNGVNFTTGEFCANAVYIVYGNDDDILVSGKIEGSEIEWVFDKQLSSLRLVGTGAMPDFASANDAPYAAYADSIKTLYVGRTITNVSKNAFSSLTSLEKAEIKDTVTNVGVSAFAGCKALSELILPDSVEKISENAFSGVENLKLSYGGTLERFAKLKVEAGNDAIVNSEKSYGKYVITWKVGDYTKVEELATGIVPVFSGAASMPIESSDKYLPFKGWNNGTRTIAPSQALNQVKANVTYTAVFGEEADRYVTGTFQNDKFSWTLDRYNGVLTVDGKGIMGDFSGKEAQPWYKYANEIYTIIVKGSITTVGKNAFCRLPVVTAIFFENGVRKILGDCFAYCDRLNTVYLPASFTSISTGASYSTNELTNVLYGGTAQKWPNAQKQISSIYNPLLSGITTEDVKCNAEVPSDGVFTVKFVDGDGTTLKEIKDVKWGEGVIPPVAPASEDFLGWDSPYFVVTDNLTVKAMYKTAPADPETETPTAEPTEEPTDEPTSSATEASASAETPATEEPTESKTTAGDDENGSNTGLIIGIAAGAAVVVIAVVVFLVLKKKKK